MPWYFVAQYPLLCDGCTCHWSFFGTGHGKGPHDGAGAVLKCYIRQSELDIKGPQLQNAQQVVDFLRLKLPYSPDTSYSRDQRHVNRVFWHIGVMDILRDEEYLVEPVKGTQNLHTVRSKGPCDPNSLLTKSLTCLCDFCLDSNWTVCVHCYWTLDWSVELLVVEKADYVRDAMLKGYLERGHFDLDALVAKTLPANCLELGDNFAIATEPNNHDNVEFELPMCVKPLYTLNKNCKSAWGEEFLASDEVVHSRY